MHLPDVNIWLALTFDSHVHHPAAKTWFDGLPVNEVCFFCRLTQQGFLRLATNRSAFGKHALRLPEAWQTYDLLLSDPRVAFSSEPADVETHWRAFTQSQTYSPQVWNDAYLAAFALAAKLTVTSFDKGLSQYPNVNCVILP
ncbi:MAG: TA system VapC family ribonuclease toxin [Gemmataceae bacterium]